jgi:hypothetical protein
MRTATAQPLRRALSLFCAEVLFFPIVGRADDCSHVIGSEIHSPNGQWTAQSKENVCGGKVLALGSDSTIVELTRHKPDYKDLTEVVLSAEGLRTENLKVRWASDYQLELTVPVHTNINEVVASYQGIDVAVNFTPPDPQERVRWVDYQRALSEWVDKMMAWDRARAADASAAGPPPPQPQWHSSVTSNPR